ncbi:hypothetical protein CMO85_01525 [Candidatus Woesearchaeota archaeon]|nr:hypothetical protein [Candidatus Woesearchaeota archaeon]
MSMKSDYEINSDTTLSFDMSTLPVLSDEEMRYAEEPNQLEFIRGFMLEESIGKYHWFGTMGFSLQYAGEGEFRCIFLVNHPEIEYCMALVNHTVKHLGGHIVLAPYTIVVAYVAREEEAVGNPAPKEEYYGMEVA